MFARLSLSHGVLARSKIERTAPPGIDAVRNQRFRRSLRFNERLLHNVALTLENHPAGQAQSAPLLP
jgi:hypothetical protein